MTDEFDALKASFDAATPKPDPQVRADHLALAQKNFADLQGSREHARPIPMQPKTGLLTGVKNMLNSLTTRGGLTATTALVAGAFVLLTPLGQTLLNPPTSSLPGRDASPTLAQTNDQSTQTGGDVSDAASTEPRVLPAPPAAEVAVLPAPLAPMSDRAMTKRAILNAPVSDLADTGASLGAPMITQEHLPEPPALRETNTEEFANANPNKLHIATETPVSTFSIDVDTASYALVRDSLMNGYLPPPDAVRIEEMINYFSYEYPSPDSSAPFRPSVTVTPTPWNSDTQLVQIGIQGMMPDISERPALNLVFLIDTSGSMNQPDKLPLLIQSFRLMLGQLRAQDEVAIVTYAGSAGMVLEPTPAAERDTIMRALTQLQAGGSTAGQAGLQQAYHTAAQMTEQGEVSRVILATDGDFNVGLSDPEMLKEYIADQRDSGTYLSVLGFGRGNLDDATMQALAQNGNGQAAYIDTLSEAQKVLVDQLSGALFPIADDVKIQVEFNPAQIAEYRLIGYETRALRREDFNNDAVDAGEIGAGHSVTALYEVTPVGSPAQLSDPLRYGTATQPPQSDELGFLRLRFKEPGSETSKLIEQPILQDAPTLGDNGFAGAIAGFGQLLRAGTYLNGWTYEDAIAAAIATRGDDPFGYRAEAIQLMRLAQSLSAN